MRRHLVPTLPGLPKFGLAAAGLRLRHRPPGTPRVPRGERGPADRIALTELRGHLTFTAGTVTAWYTVAEAVWPFRSDARREELVKAIAGQYAALAGTHLHLRRTTVPFPIAEWARELDQHAKPLPDAPDAMYSPTPLQPGAIYVPPTWSAHLTAARDRLCEGQYAIGRTHLGVTFPRPGRLLRSFKRGAGNDLDEAFVKRVDQLTKALATFGLDARPSTPAEMSWLIHRSVGVGLTPPYHRAGNIGPDDITEFADAVEITRGPYSSTTQLVDRRTGETAHVAVLTVGRMEPQEVPQEHQPWAHLADEADWPVEWSSRVNILGPDASRGSLERRLLMILSQQRDYADHGLPEPLELGRLAQRASEVSDEVATGLPVDASRVHGWHRVAVSGATAEECLERARALTHLYDQKAHITLALPKGQYRLLREFIPGEPVADTRYLRRMSTKMFAAAMPQATASVGDHRGDLIGHTATSGTRPVFWDPHFPMEVREASGLAVFASEPGGGKSTLLGALGYLAARRGVQVTLMDPSGPLARLCDLPELRPYSRVIDLVGSQRGTLAPYSLIPTPQRHEYSRGDAGTAAYDSAVANAQAERAALVLDITQMLLPPQVIEDSAVILALREALRQVPADEESTLDDVVDALDRIGAAGNVAAKSAAGLLGDASRLPLAQLFFGSPPPGLLDAEARFTVITMGGLRLPPPGSDRRYWSIEESLAVPMLHTAHRLAVRRCYGGDINARKLVALDEAHFMEGWGSGKAFLVRLARDSRKWNVAALVASQNPADILGLDVQNLVSTVFVGRIADDQKVAAEALRLLRVPVDVGYESVLASLSQHADTTSTDRLGYREFVMRDVDGRVQKIRVDMSYVRGLLAALDTTPGGVK